MDEVIAKLEAQRASYRKGQKWQFRSKVNGEWVDYPLPEPAWFIDSEYRLKPEVTESNQ